MTPEAKILIEYLKEEMANGESSLDVAVRVYGILKEGGNEHMAKEFNDHYTDYYNGDVDELDKEKVEQVIKVLETL